MSRLVLLPLREQLTVARPIGIALALVALPASADDNTAPSVSQLPTVVITATRLPTPETDLGSSVTVITSDEIAQKQYRTLPEVLEDVPGLNVVQTGGPGGTTSVFIRGTNANHTKVFIDGIDASDPSSPDGSFDFSQLLAADIERVEVLRGPASGLYGSDAIGGVINIMTKKGSGPAKIRAMIEGGSFGTFNQGFGLSGSTSRINYDFDVSHYHAGDTLVTPSDLVPPGRPVNPDSYDNQTYSARLGADVTDNFDVGLVARYVETTLRSTGDDFLGPEAIPTYSDNREWFMRATGHLVLFDGAFEQTLGIGYTDYIRRYLDPNVQPAVPELDQGDRVKLDWQGNITVAPGEVVILGAEHELDEIDDNSPVTAHLDDTAGYAQLQSAFGDRFFNTISGRYDDYTQFGSAATYRIAPAILVPETGTKFKASLGNAFKAPTLDELYDNYPEFDFFANPDLKPETSRGYDFGFEQNVFGERVRFGATWFHNDIKNLITINDAGTTYENIGRATTYGLESFISYTPWTGLTFRADYTYTHAEDDILHEELIRRPKNKASLDTTWHVTEKVSLTATIVYTGSWIDTNRDATATGLTAPGYTLVNVAGSYDLGHGVTAYGRIDNLLDQHYQDPLGFLHPGIGVFAGVRATIDTKEWGG